MKWFRTPRDDKSDRDIHADRATSRAKARDTVQPPARPGDTRGTPPGRPRRRSLQFTLIAIAVTSLAIAWLRLGPLPPNLLDRTRFAQTKVVDRNGIVLYESLAASGGRGEWLTPDALPRTVVAATLAAEDRRFFSHHGIDPLAIARAMTQNVRALRVVEGGSTISQQVAKILLDSRDRSLATKAREAVVALRLEHRLSKREILALYLNLAPYGNRIHGVARASRAYFGAEASELTPAQAAFLAALPQRPGAFNPLRDRSAARKRQRSILARMHLEGSISAADLRYARAEELKFEKAAHPVLAMHFVERVLGGAKRNDTIRTSLDASLQRDVTGIITAQRENLLRHGASSVAVAVLDNRTGGWLVWEGSGDYFGTSFGGSIDGVTAMRQPGSALKPFTYALAFERGHSPATVLADVPSSFPTGEDGVVYSPRNYDGVHRGPMRVRAALAGSQNVPAVAMLAQLGAPSLLRLLRVSGFSSLDNTSDYYGLGLTLGGGEVTLAQLVTAYATFARGGSAVEPTVFRRRADFSPRAAGLQSAGGSQVFSPRTAFWISDILADDAARAYAFGRGGSLEFPFAVAVKTGTSQSYRDNWTVGYTRDVTVGVWVGNFDRRELQGSSGVTGAAPVFHAVMLAAVQHLRGSLPIGDYTPIVPVPPDVESVAVCASSGLRPSPWCPSTEVEWLPREGPARFCSWHHDGSTRWPPEYKGWARESGQLRLASSETVQRESLATVEISNPPDGATYLIDPTLRREFQTLRLRASADRPVTWRVGARRIATAAPGERVEWPLEPGRHVVSATDSAGRRDSVTITVR